MLHKYRGRGFYLILVGVLAFSCGMIGYIVGAVTLFLGISHLVLGFCFHDTLDKKDPLPGERPPARTGKDLEKGNDRKVVPLDH